MPPTSQELSLLLHPIVPESLAHNTRVLSNLRSLTSFLLGVSAAILDLESAAGFVYYVVGSSLVSLLVHFVLARGRPRRYFFAGHGHGHGAWKDVWLGAGVATDGLSGFVLGWAGVGGVIR